MKLVNQWNQFFVTAAACLLLAGCAGVRLRPLANSNRNGVYFDADLTSANVTQDTFGVLYTRTVNGHILSQPLYVPEVSGVPGLQKPDLVLVATSFNYIYAFNAKNTTPDTVQQNVRPLWLVQLGPPGALDPDCGVQTRWRIGILSTPVVVSRGRGSYTMYVVARVKKPDINSVPQVGFFLYALDVATGRILRWVEITATANNPQTQDVGIFNANFENNRPALLYDEGVIYMGFASRQCDWQPGGGWVIAYEADSFRNVGGFCTSCFAGDPQLSGIWQSGSGLAASNHHILAMTGNGPGYGNSFLALRRDRNRPMGHQLVLESSYQDPRAALQGGDVDLGSGGPIVLSDGTIAGGGKEGRLYLLNLTEHPAGASRGAISRASVSLQLRSHHQVVWNTYHWQQDALVPCCKYVQDTCGDHRSCDQIDLSPSFRASCYIQPSEYQNSQAYGPNIHGAPVYFKPDNDRYGYIYFLSEKDYVKAYRYDPESGDIKRNERPSPNNMPWAFNIQNLPQVCTTPGTPVRGFLDPASLMLNSNGSPAPESGWLQEPILPYAQSCEVRSPDGMPGGFLALSTYDLAHGILWAIVPGCDTINGGCGRGVLGGNTRAYLAAMDSQTLKPLYIEHAANEFGYYYFTKFMPPVIGGGKIFRATMDFRPEEHDLLKWEDVEKSDRPPQGMLVVYGKTTSAPPTTTSVPQAPVFQCPPQPTPP